MPVKNEKLSFLMNQQGIYGLGLSPFISLGYGSGMGADDIGFLKFSVGVFGSNETEKARTSIGGTWEDFGIPSGATILYAKIPSVKMKKVTTGTQSAQISFIQNGTYITSGGMVSVSGLNTSYTDYSGDEKIISNTYNASNTFVQLEILLNINGQGVASEVHIDDLCLEIGYNGGCSRGYTLQEPTDSLIQNFSTNAMGYTLGSTNGIAFSSTGELRLYKV